MAHLSKSSRSHHHGVFKFDLGKFLFISGVDDDGDLGDDDQAELRRCAQP